VKSPAGNVWENFHGKYLREACLWGIFWGRVRAFCPRKSQGKGIGGIVWGGKCLEKMFGREICGCHVSKNYNN